MKKDETRAPSLNTESEQLASLRSKQERHERLAREHAASAKRLWLRRVLLELGREAGKGSAGVQEEAGRRGHAAK
jgi:hypothetical protein